MAPSRASELEREAELAAPAASRAPAQSWQGGSSSPASTCPLPLAAGNQATAAWVASARASGGQSPPGARPEPASEPTHGQPDIQVVSIPTSYQATRVPPRPLPGLGASTYMASQGAHDVGAMLPPGRPSIANGMRLLGTEYWRALIPAPRAIELERTLNELPRDLEPWLTTWLKETPPDVPPEFPWVSETLRGMDRPFTVEELTSIPSLVRRFNSNRASLSPAELALLRRTISLHVDAGQAYGSPWVSWSKPGAGVAWSHLNRFVVRATFDPKTVLDNMHPSPANTLTRAERYQGMLDPFNESEAEFLATCGDDARILTVEPMNTAVKGELVAGSTRWMAQHATALRWTGRGLLAVSLATSGYRIATAGEAESAHVWGEEIGGQTLGIGGAVLAGAGCVAFGIATGGVGLLLCGLAGGLAGGVGGSILGGAIADELSEREQDGTPTAGLASDHSGHGASGSWGPHGATGGWDDPGTEGSERLVLISPVTGETLLLSPGPAEELHY